jgi:DNA-binding transcriptional MerR regulator
MIRQVRWLLYEKGYTIGGAKAYLDSDSNKSDSNRTKQLIHQMLTELEEVLELLK